MTKISQRKKNKIRVTVLVCLIFTSILLLFLRAGLNSSKFMIVHGNSMAPTIKDLSLVVIKQSNHYKDGDIIIFKFNNEILIKRIIYSGDSDNLWYTDDIYPDDPSMEIYNCYNEEEYKAVKSYKRISKIDFIKLSTNEYWFNGDNIFNTASSAGLGPIEKSDIIGVADYTIGFNGVKKF